MGARPEEAGLHLCVRRTFVAIELPAAVRRVLAGLRDKLQRQWPGAAVRWARPEGTHLTLRFLGDTTERQVAEVESGLRRIAAELEPFDMSLTQVGTFPREGRPRVIWVGVADDGAHLRPLQRAVEELARSLGWERERQAYVPHLTLGRVRPKVSPPAKWGANVEGIGFRVDRVALMESLLRPTGAEYARIGEVPLGGISPR